MSADLPAGALAKAGKNKYVLCLYLKKFKRQKFIHWRNEKFKKKNKKAQFWRSKIHKNKKAI